MILESYARGMTFGEDDVLIVADILPNRPGVFFMANCILRLLCYF